MAQIRLSPIRRLRRGPFIQIGSPRRFEWNAYDLPITALPPALDGLRIVHLTDLHLRPHWWRSYDELIERVAAADADLVLITGDVVEHQFDHRAALPTAERFCRALRARHGVFVTLGNHDGDLFGAHLARFGVQPLNRRIARVQVRGATIELIGVPGVLRSDIPAFVLENAVAFEEGNPSRVRLALTHFPDSILRLGDLAPDVVFAGHTHGGQVCLPSLAPSGWPIIRHDALPREMCSGVFRFEGGRWLVIGRGFGFATYSIRLFCPAEVIEITLRSGSPATARTR